VTEVVKGKLRTWMDMLTGEKGGMARKTMEESRRAQQEGKDHTGWEQAAGILGEIGEHRAEEKYSIAGEKGKM
jgi:hypothetical protein